MTARHSIFIAESNRENASDLSKLVHAALNPISFSGDPFMQRGCSLGGHLMKTRLLFTPGARGRGMQSARLKAIKDDILAHIADERLSVTNIARRHGVTPRSVRLLFKADGGTFSKYVIEQRLVRAYRMLTEVKFADWTIGAIGFDTGFSDLSYFNRTFRRRYSATPSSVREAAQRENGRS
jgi:transcriptional regulator GlxA family with amidase domain